MLALTISIAVLCISSTEAQAQTQITIYAKEYAFGLSADSTTSPGPTLTLTSGDTVTVTLTNVGTMAHGWALTDQPQTGANKLFSASINQISAGTSDSVTFTVGSPGTYYYICPVPGHVSLGMWGMVQVVNGGASGSPAPTASASPSSTPSANPSATVSPSSTVTPSRSPSPSPTIPELSILALIGIMAAALATLVISRKRFRIAKNR